MHSHSIRFRLTVWYAAVLTAGLALFGVLLWVSLRHQLLADIDEELDGRASRFESYAAHFAAKEAGMKALGTGWSRGVRWRDIEVVRPKGQRPTLQFHGEAANVAARLGTKNIALSITHTSEQALAHVILEN